MSQVLQNIESAEPAPLHRRSREPDSPWADGEVSTIILKALAKDPARRYQTAAGLGNDITRYLAGEAIEARRDSTWYLVRKAAARHRVVVAATGLIFFLLTAFGAAMAWQAHRLEIRGTELARALSASHVDRGRSLAAAGQAPLAEDLVFPELIKAGVRRIDGPDVGFAGSSEALHAYWGLWDIFRSSRCVATLGTHVENPTLPQPFPTPDWPAVKLVYFDQNGRRLNALDGLGRLRSWMVATWEQDREKSLFKPVDKVSFRFARSPGGSIAVFGAGKIRVFNPETGSLEAEMDDPDEQAVTGEFSPDGTLMATIGRGFQLRVRDATSLATIVMTADGRAVDPTAIPRSKPSFSLDGRRVAASRDDASIGVWNTVSGSLERSLRPPASLVEKYRSKFVRFGRLAVAPDGTMASFFGLNLIVWSSDGGEPRDLGEPGGTLTNLAFLSGSNGMKLVTTGSTPGGGGGITVIWDVATGVREATFNHPDDSLAMTTSPDGQLVVAGMSNGMVQVYGADPEPHVTALQVGRIWPFPKMALSPDGRTLAITTQEGSESDHEVFLIDLKTRATISRFHQAGPELIALEFSRDGLSLFESDRSGRIVQRDLASGLQMRQFAFPSDSSGAEPRLLNAAMGGTNQLRLSPDGRILATGRDDGMIGLWDVPSGNWLGVLDSGLRESVVIDFGADGSTLAAQHNESMVVWDLSARRPKLTLPTKGYPACVRCSPAGPVIARSTGGRINFLNTDTGQVSGVTAANTSGMAEAFHSGGAVFFATAWDVSVRLWDVRTGGELISLQKHSQFTRELVVSRDGSTLISSDWPGTVLVWDLTYYNDRIRRELASRITRAAGP
jgi:WD40 repeat protein